jgi:cobalamin-dependent methionine synthase I
MGDEENRMPKNARREKNSKKESERERERKKKRNRKRERESSQRKNSNTIWGDIEAANPQRQGYVHIIPKGPCHIYIYIRITSYIYIHLCNARLEKQRDAKGNQFVGDGSSMTAHGKNPCPRDHLQ